jgi:phosphoribosylformylglycinamidine synthase
MIAVAEAARNLVCVGALPTAITNNLNFGNPLKAHIYYQFREAVLGMKDACEAFETPVTGGNVSFYNETDGRAIYPTPVIGMVGVIDDASKIVGQTFRTEGDDIVLLGRNTDEIGGSEYLYVTAGLVAGAPPGVDLAKERALQQAVLMMTHGRHLNSAHDCSDGGLVCTLAECALGDGEAAIGIQVQLDDDLAPVATLFAESQGRIVVSCAPEQTGEVLRIAEGHGVPAARIGSVTARHSPFRVVMSEGEVEADVAEMADAYFGALPDIMDAPSTSSA